MTLTFYAMWGAIFAGLAVVLGAFGAHALKDSLDEYSLSIWDKAVFYQSIHALALFVLPLFSDRISERAIAISGGLFIAGIILFSGSLYILALTGKRYLGAITPFGGVAFILAWAWLIVAFARGVFRS